MILFITRILMISTIFIGLGAITDEVWKAVSQNRNECQTKKIKIIKVEKSDTAASENVIFEQSLEGKRIFIFRQD